MMTLDNSRPSSASENWPRFSIENLPSNIAGCYFRYKTF